MKRQTVHPWNLLASLTIALFCVAPPCFADDTADANNKLLHKLYETIIPEVNLRNAAISDVVRFLGDETKRLDPDHRGVNIVLRMKKTTKEATNPEPAFEGGHLTPSVDVGPMVTLSLRNVPLIDAISYIAASVHMRYQIESDSVSISDSSSASPPSSAPELPKWAQELNSQRRDALIKRLDSIVMPTITFRNAALRDVVRFLSDESRRLDPPNGIGVNIVLLVNEPAEKKVTLTLRNISITDALHEVAGATALRIRVDPSAVVLTPSTI